jgi:hypothetical protein
MANGDDIRDDGLPGEQDPQNQGMIVGLGLVALVILVIFVVALVGGATASPPAPSMCSTSCAVFVRFECPGNRIMGTCFGVAVCDQPVHPCGANPP